MIIHEYDIDMVPNKGKIVSVWVNQYDEDFILKFNLFASSGEFTVQSGTTVAIRGTKPDGNGYSADASLNENVVTVTGDQQMTAVAGKSIFELTLYKNDKELSTANFILNVEKAALDSDTIQSESVLRELDAIIEGAETATQAADDATDAADRAEEAARTLTIDDTLTQTGQAADAKKTGDEISDLKGALNEYFGKHIAIQMSAEMQFINLSGSTADINNPSSSSEGYHYAVVPCQPGDVFEVNAVGGAGARAWGFINTNGTILSVADSLTTVNTEMTAPANSAYFIVNDRSGQTSYKLNGDTIPERVSTLESAVNSFEGISDEVKEALLACFRHVAFLDDEEDYYGALEEALLGEIPEIKVFLGKGTSGTSIVDNTKRALSEPIPFTNTIPIVMEWSDNNGYVWQPKPLTSQHGITRSIVGIDTNGTVYDNDNCRLTPNPAGGYWTKETGKLTLTGNDSIQVRVQDTDGYFRIMFANGDDQSADLPSNPPSGFFFVGNKKYRLVVGNNEDFI